jgi:hypothetical protein
MSSRSGFQFGDLVAIPWGVGEVRGRVHEIYGEPPRRYVVVMLSPELSSYVVDGETTATVPYDSVDRVEEREAV